MTKEKSGDWGEVSTPPPPLNEPLPLKKGTEKGCLIDSSDLMIEKFYKK